MLVPPSRKMASMLFSAIKRRAFSMRARRSSSEIGVTGGSGANASNSPRRTFPTSEAPSATPALRPTKLRLFMAGSPCLHRLHRVPLRRLYAEQVMHEEIVSLPLAVGSAVRVIGAGDHEEIEHLVRLDERI